MKKTLTIFAIAGLAIALSVPSFAQAPGPSGGQGTLQARGQGRGGGMRMMQEILAKLNLTPAQKTQIEALQKKQRDQFKQWRDSGTRPDPAKMKAARESWHKQLLSILTPAQQKQFKQEMEAARKKWQQEHPNAPQGGKGGGKA